MPVGTEVWNASGEPSRIADLSAAGETVVAARGGKGGRGNARFVSPTNRFPLLAEEGDAAEELDLRLELKLLADVGIVGAPNAGKSSLLAAVSAARPKVAGYPFTTLEPVLGVVEHRGASFVMVDIPGLIEGAHGGAGLGDDFLRHVERTRVLVHLVDGAGEDPVADYHRVRRELSLFHEDLADKPSIVGVNKIDIPEVVARCDAVRDQLMGDGAVVHCISAAGRQGLEALLDGVLEVLAQVPQITEAAPREGSDKPVPVLRPQAVDRRDVVRRQGRKYVVSLPAATRLAGMVDEDNWDARMQLYEQLRRLGVIAELEKAGIRPGQVFSVGKLELEWD